MWTTQRAAVRVGLITAAAITFLSSATAQAQTSLRWKFKEGEKLNYTTETVMKQTASVMGMDIETSMNQAMDISWLVNSVDDEKAAVTQKIERMRQKMEAPFGDYEYDSKDGKQPIGPIGEVLGPIFEAMVGAEFTFNMDPLGEISDTKVSDKLVDALKNNPNLAQMGAMFSEEGLKNMVAQSSATFPKEAISKGKTWNKKMEVKLPFGTMKMDNTFTYQGPETRNDVKLEKIDMKSEVSIEPADNAQIELKIKSADVKGAIYFDNSAGRIVEMVSNQKMAMEISVMGNVFDSSQNQTVTMKLAK